jgi:Ca2+-binding RTX toxin-like protein
MPTVVGGGSIGVTLDLLEITAAQQALAAIGTGYPNTEIHTAVGQPVVNPTFLQVLDLPGGGNYVVGPPEQVVVISSDPSPTAPTTITGNGFNGLIIGNQGNDTVNFGTGSGSVFAGDGNNVVNLGNGSGPGGSVFIEFGTGVDMLNMAGGSATVSQVGGGQTGVVITQGTNHLDGLTPLNVVVQGGTNDLDLDGGLTKILGGSNTLNLTGNDTVISYGGTTSINITGNGTDYIYGNNDTVTLGSGNDTVVISGNATAFAGSGNQQITAVTGNDSLVAGTGSATMTGGTGNDTYVGGSGHDTFVAGSGINLFSFSSDTAMSGGTHVIQGFQDGRDQIQLVGYDTAAALSNAQVVGGSTVISLDSGHTTITLTNFTNLNPTDIKH